MDQWYPFFFAHIYVEDKCFLKGAQAPNHSASTQLGFLSVRDVAQYIAVFVKPD